jgi:hypothetical protein
LIVILAFEIDVRRERETEGIAKVRRTRRTQAVFAVGQR